MGFDISDLIERSIVNRSHERPLEYLFVWTALAALSPTMPADRSRVRILDIRGSESHMARTLAELGFDVTVIDINDVRSGGAKFIRANILEHEFPEGDFDIIIAISTVEHVGLPAYEQTLLDEDGDIKAMAKIHRWLREGGFAIVTLPYGRPHHPPSFERTYNRRTLGERILSIGWEVIAVMYSCYDGVWRVCTEPETSDRDACVCLLLRKPGVIP
jgi:SAM-dependent methyltransferase